MVTEPPPQVTYDNDVNFGSPAPNNNMKKDISNDYFEVSDFFII